MSTAKRRRTKNRRAAFVMGLDEETYVYKLVMDELPYRLSMKRVMRIMRRGGDGIIGRDANSIRSAR